MSCRLPGEEWVRRQAGALVLVGQAAGGARGGVGLREWRCEAIVGCCCMGRQREGGVDRTICVCFDVDFGWMGACVGRWIAVAVLRLVAHSLQG